MLLVDYLAWTILCSVQTGNVHQGKIIKFLIPNIYFLIRWHAYHGYYFVSRLNGEKDTFYSHFKDHYLLPRYHVTNHLVLNDTFFRKEVRFTSDFNEILEKRVDITQAVNPKISLESCAR